MRLRRSSIVLLTLVALVVPVWAVPAAAVAPPERGRAIPSPDEDGSHEQHGGPGGHLPGSSANVDLVGQVTVSGATGVDKPGHIADVAVGGNHAYLAARRLTRPRADRAASTRSTSSTRRTPRR